MLLRMASFVTLRNKAMGVLLKARLRLQIFISLTSSCLPRKLRWRLAWLIQRYIGMWSMARTVVGLRDDVC
jgi:hypothetical protein